MQRFRTSFASTLCVELSRMNRAILLRFASVSISSQMSGISGLSIDTKG